MPLSTFGNRARKVFFTAKRHFLGSNSSQHNAQQAVEAQDCARADGVSPLEPAVLSVLLLRLCAFCRFFSRWSRCSCTAATTAFSEVAF
eukprot:1351423-Rhodomonas_salina.1